MITYLTLWTFTRAPINITNALPNPNKPNMPDTNPSKEQNGASGPAAQPLRRGAVSVQTRKEYQSLQPHPNNRDKLLQYKGEEDRVGGEKGDGKKTQ